MEHWSLTPNLEILKRTWDGECAVYLTHSRETHLLNIPCAHLLEVLEMGPMSFDGLQDRLQSFVGDVAAQEVSDLAHEIVSTLTRIGIIETVEDAS